MTLPPHPVEPGPPEPDRPTAEPSGPAAPERPTTEAGRILLLEHSSGRPHMARHIIATEVEAVSDEHERLAAAVEALPNDDQCYCELDRRPHRTDDLYVSRAAVLALLASPAQPGERE